jgi:hypothetical protein
MRRSDSAARLRNSPLANEHVCRNSCVVPAAVFKALEVEANIFPPAESQIVFVDGVEQIVSGGDLERCE